MIKVRLTPLQRKAHLILGEYAVPAARKNYKLRQKLTQAHMTILPEAYIAWVWLVSAISGIVGIVIAVVLFILFSFLGVGGIFIMIALLPALAGPITYKVLMGAPNSKTKARGKNIDLHIAYASNFISAMASSNATPQTIFKSLSNQYSIYGEIANEALWIYKDITLLGIDLITAIKSAVDRSPSYLFKDFLQGFLGILQSGGNMKNYFMSKAENYMRENRRKQGEFIETISFMAESYVTVAIAMPMFLMIILVIGAWISNMGGTMLLYVVSFLVLPVIHLGFVYIIVSSTEKE